MNTLNLNLATDRELLSFFEHWQGAQFEECGLCWALETYLEKQRGMDWRNPVYAAVVNRFEKLLKANFPEGYNTPFNDGLDNYLSETYTKKCHLNPKRIAFVQRMIDTAEEAR